jgi:3-phosphoshikimate 1-carboxyvinyltransferase
MMLSPVTVTVRPARGISGSLRLPGDKSISHRYAMLGAIAQGATKIGNFSTGADCASTLSCLKQLGVEVTREGNAIVIEGRGPNLTCPQAPLDCGNSGSTMRMLSGILAGQEFTSELIGDESLSRRPMARIISPLQQMGAKIVAHENNAPLRISGGPLRGISYATPVPSAQVKTSLLFAGLYAQGETRVSENLRTRDHGEIALRAFGADVKQEQQGPSIRGGQALHGIEAVVPGDISTAAFFLCAAGIFPGSEVFIDSLLMNPTRARLLDVLIRMGIHISVLQIEDHHGELSGTVKVTGGELRGASIQGADAAFLIDELPVLAAIAPYTSDGVEIRDARELRIKESDRISAVASNLRKMGAVVQELEDGMKIPGRQKLHGAELDSFGDHRIAMAFAIAALRAEGDTQISGADVASISYPAFFETLESMVQQ